ncbi:MAG: hypothetical protein IJ504_00665 [Bacteroidales bacterium]|nr:hypothetical protein [Bacteroidales bacterium]
MRKIHAIKKYDVTYGDTYNYNPCIVSMLLKDCEMLECMTYGDPDMDDDGLYEFDREGFKEAVNWAAQQDEQYFEKFRNYVFGGMGTAKSQVLYIMKGLLSAGSEEDPVRLEVW